MIKSYVMEDDDIMKFFKKRGRFWIVET